MDSTKLIWAGGLIAHLALLSVLFRKQRASRFPAFTVLIAFYLCRSLSLVLLFNRIPAPSYNLLFWALALFDLLLQTVVLATLIREATRKARYSQSRTALWGVATIALAAILVLFWGPWPSLVSPETGSLNTFMLLSLLASKGNLLLGLLTLEAWVALQGIARRSGLGWKSHAQRIVHGLGFYAFVNLAVQAIIQKLSMPSAEMTFESMHSKMTMIHNLGYVRNMSYFVSVLYWLIFLWREETLEEPLQDRQLEA